MANPNIYGIGNNDQSQGATQLQVAGMPYSGPAQQFQKLQDQGANYRALLGAQAAELPAQLQQQRFGQVFPFVQGEFNSLKNQQIPQGGGAGGNQPNINAAPVYNQQQTQQAVNAARAGNDQNTATNQRQNWPAKLSPAGGSAATRRSCSFSSPGSRWPATRPTPRSASSCPSRRPRLTPSSFSRASRPRTSVPPRTCPAGGDRRPCPVHPAADESPVRTHGRRLTSQVCTLMQHPDHPEG